MDYGYGGGYSTTSYGAQGGADGGGFVGGSQANSQETPGGTKRYGQDTLRPVTIKQLIDAVIPYPDAEPKIDGVGVTHVDFVGQVRKLSAQATNTTYVVDDGTGVMDVKQWNDNDLPAEAQKFKPNEGDYIHVWGRLKEFSNKRHVGSHVIHPVKDYNEINYHLLHATAVHLYFLRGPIGAQNDIKQEPGMFVDGYGGETNGAGAGGKKLPANTSAIAKKVYTLLQSAPQNNEGLHVNQIATQLSMQLNDVFKAGDELLGDGLIYTTIDDETWAVLEY